MPKLYLYNTLSNQKQEFTPIKPKQISMYVCGVTVYDHCHIGHARTYITFDLLYKYLKHLGYKVKYVRNITDIEDKIINRANQNNIDYKDLVNQYTQYMHQDFAALNIAPPTDEPKATDYIDDMINHIGKLIELGFAYKINNGDIYFQVGKFKDYGKLSGQNLAQLKAGARVEANSQKKHPADFVLWKSAKPNEPSWESPWGAGRPGWHIECSAMSKQVLGLPFDIHGGGSDLMFPHHENECAQTCAIDKKFANYWVHSGMVKVNTEKMSKSLGNFFTIKDVIKEYNPEVIRLFLLSAHYRSGLNYSEDNLNSAQAGLIRIYQTLSKTDFKILAQSDNLDITKNPDLLDWQNQFEQALSDDLNTPIAFRVIFQLCKQINKTRSDNINSNINSNINTDINSNINTQLSQTLRQLCKILDIGQQNPQDFLHNLLPKDIDINNIENLIEQRITAREQKDWANADKIRDQLIDLGIQLEDSQLTTLWTPKRTKPNIK